MNNRKLVPLSCMDGRIRIPLSNWIKENYSVDYVDTITEPGIDKKVAENSSLQSLKDKIAISVNATNPPLLLSLDIMIVQEIPCLMKNIWHT